LRSELSPSIGEVREENWGRTRSPTLRSCPPGLSYPVSLAVSVSRCSPNPSASILRSRPARAMRSLAVGGREKSNRRDAMKIPLIASRQPARVNRPDSKSTKSRWELSRLAGLAASTWYLVAQDSGRLLAMQRGPAASNPRRGGTTSDGHQARTGTEPDAARAWTPGLATSRPTSHPDHRGHHDPHLAQPLIVIRPCPAARGCLPGGWARITQAQQAYAHRGYLGTDRSRQARTVHGSHSRAGQVLVGNAESSSLSSLPAYGQHRDLRGGERWSAGAPRS
jgi:hypothetical protein